MDKVIWMKLDGMASRGAISRKHEAGLEIKRIFPKEPFFQLCVSASCLARLRHLTLTYDGGKESGLDNQMEASSSCKILQ
jgi:hypothetical protein